MAQNNQTDKLKKALLLSRLLVVVFGVVGVMVGVGIGTSIGSHKNSVNASQDLNPNVTVAKHLNVLGYCQDEQGTPVPDCTDVHQIYIRHRDEGKTRHVLFVEVTNNQRTRETNLAYILYDDEDGIKTAAGHLHDVSDLFELAVAEAEKVVKY